MIVCSQHYNYVMLASRSLGTKTLSLECLYKQETFILIDLQSIASIPFLTKINHQKYLVNIKALFTYDCLIITKLKFYH